MAVGRLPANNVADVTAMVDKMLIYESSALNPQGLWQQRAVYVADDCSDSAGNFHYCSNFGRLQWLPTSYAEPTESTIDNPTRPAVCPDGTHTVRPICDRRFERPSTRGRSFIQWFGHGSQTVGGYQVACLADTILAC